MIYPDTVLSRKVERRALPVIVSLPRHEMGLAEAARDAGVDALKLHLNAWHRASGTTFGTLDQERAFFRRAATLGLPLLVMAGQDRVPTETEMDELADLGVEGFNVYLDHLQPHLLRSRLRPIPALSSDSPPEAVERVRAIPGAWVEASVTAFPDYGKPLSSDDLDRYRKVAASGLPTIAPSQKRFVADDVPKLRDAGVAALLLGVIVTGSTAETLAAAVAPIVARARATG
jgi:hypothetical protein